MGNPLDRAGILAEVNHERGRQDAKWGTQRHHDDTWVTVLVEEVGEAAQDVLKGRRSELRAELIQIAAVAVAWVECLDSGQARVERLSEAERAGAATDARQKLNPWPPTFAHVSRWLAATERLGRAYIPDFPLAIRLDAKGVSERARCPSCDAAPSEACRG